MVSCVLRSISMFIALLSLTSCYKKQIEITCIKIDRHSLASSFTHAPDPRQSNPPLGEQLLMSLNLDPEIDITKCRAVLSLIYHNLETQNVEYMLNKPKENWSFFLLGEKYQKYQGFLAYKLEVFFNDRCVALYQHPMWFEKIQAL
jgi:hypothetical protein